MAVDKFPNSMGKAESSGEAAKIRTLFKNQEISLNQIAVVCERSGKIMVGKGVLGGTNMAT